MGWRKLWQEWTAYRQRYSYIRSSRMSSTPTSPLSPFSPLDPSHSNEVIYTAVQGHIPRHEGEIKVKVGDIVSNVKDLGNGWSLGQNITRDRLGIFPTYCIIISDQSKTGQISSPISVLPGNQTTNQISNQNSDTCTCADTNQSQNSPQNRAKTQPLLSNIDETKPLMSSILEGEAPLRSNITIDNNAASPVASHQNTTRGLIQNNTNGRASQAHTSAATHKQTHAAIAEPSVAISNNRSATAAKKLSNQDIPRKAGVDQAPQDAVGVTRGRRVTGNKIKGLISNYGHSVVTGMSEANPPVTSPNDVIAQSSDVINNSETSSPSNNRVGGVAGAIESSINLSTFKPPPTSPQAIRSRSQSRGRQGNLDHQSDQDQRNTDTNNDGETNNFQNARRAIAQKLGGSSRGIQNNEQNCGRNDDYQDNEDTVSQNDTGYEHDDGHFNQNYSENAHLNNKNQSDNQLRIDPGRNYPHTSPVYSTVSEAHNSNPPPQRRGSSDHILSGGSDSLPPQGRRGRSQTKPKLVVKPNHTHGMDSNEESSDMLLGQRFATAANPRSPMRGQGQPRSSSRTRPSPVPPRRTSSAASGLGSRAGSNPGTPVLQRARTHDPPRNLSLRGAGENTGYGANNNAPPRHSTERLLQGPGPAPRGILINRSGEDLLHVCSPDYDESDLESPDYLHHNGVNTGCYDHHNDDELDNYANEHRQCMNSSNSLRHSNDDIINTCGELDRDELYGDYRTNKRPPRSPKTPRHAMDKSVRFQNQPNSNLPYKPILKNATHKVSDSKGQHIYYNSHDYPPKRSNNKKHTNKPSCLLFSILAALIFGALIFLWMYFFLEYALIISIAASITIMLFLMLLFVLSRLCRCVAALLFPSLCTTRGRIVFLVLITSILVRGPVKSIYFNMREVSRSMSCSAEQVYNQSRVLLEPFDAMMHQLDVTVAHLQHAAYDVSVGLAPLDQGLEKMDRHVVNGHVQLAGTARVCEKMIKRAYDACSTDIIQAKQQCNEAIAALGTVYLKTKEFLDQTNLDRFAPDHVKEQHLFKRQILGGTASTLVDEETEDDICEPLNKMQVCHNLNDSAHLCKPSKWAGEAIEEAINNTQDAMERLKTELQFNVDPDFYQKARANVSRHVYDVRKHVLDEFDAHSRHFEFIIQIMLKLLPLIVLLLVYVAYLYVKNYMSRDTYDNNYVTRNFKELDIKRAEVAGNQLLPLKRYERNLLIDTMQCDLSPPEEGLYKIGLCVLFIHLSLSVACYLFDYVIYWILNVIRNYGHPESDVTGQGALENVLDGQGAIVELLSIFLDGFHRGSEYGFRSGENKCLPNPHEPEIHYLVVILIAYLLLIVTILLKAYLLRLRNRITGYFYPERAKARTVHLYNVILNQRARMPRLLHMRVRINHRRHEQQQQISLCHKMAARCAPCRVFLYEAPKCLVCNAPEDHESRDCETEGCGGVYCARCYADLHHVCPLCMQGADYDETYGSMHGRDGGNRDRFEPDVEDEIAEVAGALAEVQDEQTFEDDLQPYHRSSKIYL